MSHSKPGATAGSEQHPLTDEQIAQSLQIARELAATGVPLFVAPPDPSSSSGFALPTEWQATTPDPAVVDRWQPGWALCAVMGCGLDLVDVDPRSGGDLSAMNGSTPRHYAVATTPSGGLHLFIASTASGSRDGVYPGIDIKSGTIDGTGRGFAFLAPTVRMSKVTGQPVAYRWHTPPDLEALSAVLRGEATDTSGEALAARVRALKAESGGVRKVGGPDWWREFAQAKEPQAMAAAERAIKEKLAEVAELPVEPGQGQRQIIMRAAMTLGGYVGSGYLTESDAWAKLESAVTQVWGAVDEDDRQWIRDGLTDGASRPFYVYTPEQDMQFGDAAQAVAATRAAMLWSPYRALGTEAFDPQYCAHDQEFAEAVATRTVPILRFAVDSGTWLVRGAQVWREREDMSAWAVSMVARLMPLGDPSPVVKGEPPTAEQRQAKRRARFLDSGGSGKIERKLRSIVRGLDHPLATEVAELDADPEILWAGGQAWDLRASLERPVPASQTRGVVDDVPHLHTASVIPEMVATPTWDRFVAGVFPDPDLRSWALRVLSVALTGYPDAVLPVLYGTERTGKTALISLIVDLLGSYGHAADPRLLSPDNSGGHASIVYVLKGRRLSFIDEGPRRGHPATERLKQLTGGAPLTGNAMRANPITFKPTHTLVMTTNDEPPVRDPALVARLRVIPCEGDRAEVRTARQAITPAVWAQEGPGVLALLMSEAAAYLADLDSAGSDRAPASIRAAVEEMVAGQNPVNEWVANNTVPADPGTPGRQLYHQFAAWFDGQAIYKRQSPPSETAFGRTLTELGYPSTQHGTGNDKRWYRPLSVMGGGDGRAPWEPMWPAGATGPGRVPGESGQGSGADPAQPENPRSTPVSSSSWAGWAGSSTTSNYNNNITTPKGVVDKKVQPNRDSAANPPQNPVQTTSDQGGQVTQATRPQDHEMSRAGNGEGSSSATPDPSPSVDPEPAKPREPSNSEVAARAYQGGDEKKITKTEARRQLKEEARLAAVAEASGQRFTFPVIVGRNGVIAELSTDDAVAQVREAIRRTGALTVDVEHTGYPIGHVHYELRTVQLGDAHVTVIFDPVEHAELVSTLLAEAPKLHAHSATADLVPLEHAGLLERIGGAEAAWARMFDTVLPAKLADPASTGSDPELKKLSAAVLGAHSVAPAAEEARKSVFAAGRWLENTKLTTEPERSGWAQIDRHCAAMVAYAASDVLDTAALAQALPVIPDALMERERLAQRLTARVTHRGIRIDRERVARLSAEHGAARAEIGAKLRGSLGIENPGSDRQIATALLGRGAPLPISDKGNPSVAEAVLQKLIAEPSTPPDVVEAASTVLEYRHHDTVLGTFLEPYQVLCDIGDGRARPTVYTLGTNTGRMSCVRPNAQQLPKVGGIRALYLADPGELMIGADFSGVEIRVAAALSQDPTLLAFLREGRDLHAEIARQVWGESAGKAERYRVKPIVFGRFYGGGIPTLSAQAGVSESIGAAVVDVLDDLAPVLASWSAEIRNAARRGHTQFPSYSGRIIHLPRERSHAAPNYAIQGTARELLVDALVRWAEGRWGNATLLPVHDELDIWVPEDEATEATAELVRCMETELYGVKIIADPSEPSPFWADSV